MKTLKQLLESQGSGYPDTLNLETRIKVFGYLDSKFSTLTLQDGLSKDCQGGHNLKATVVRNWSVYCSIKNPQKPTSHDRIGITTGPYNGLLVLDCDDETTFEAWLTTQGYTLPKTLTVGTGKGKHYYYRYPKDGKSYRNRSFKKRGYDIRGDGGYVLSIGSLHPDTGKPYVVLEWNEIADAPAWLLEQALTGNQPEQPMDTLSVATMPIQTDNPLLVSPKVGERSEHSISLMEGLVRSGLSDDQIKEIFWTTPAGEKAHEKGEAWFYGELGRAKAFVAATSKPESKKKVNVIEELLKIVNNIEYFKYNNSFIYAKIK